jgi:hypothetical protein
LIKCGGAKVKPALHKKSDRKPCLGTSGQYGADGRDVTSAPVLLFDKQAGFLNSILPTL